MKPYPRGLNRSYEPFTFCSLATGAANISNINVDHKRLTRHNLIKAIKPFLSVAYLQQKEKTMYGHSNYNYFVKIYYIKNNNKANETFIFDNRKEYSKFFDYVLKLRHNRDSNIYDIAYGHAYKVGTTKDAINKLLDWGDVLLPSEKKDIDVMNMEFEEA